MDRQSAERPTGTSPAYKLQYRPDLEQVILGLDKSICVVNLSMHDVSIGKSRYVRNSPYLTCVLFRTDIVVLKHSLTIQ